MFLFSLRRPKQIRFIATFIFGGRELLSPMLDEASYRALGSTQKQIDEVVRRTRSAVVQHDWAEAGKLAAQAEQVRKRIDALASVSGLARDAHDSDPVAFDPFSPGKHLGQQAQAMQSGIHARILATLESLAKEDTVLGAFYENRRGYFSGLEIAAAAISEKSSERSRAQLEQLAREPLSAATSLQFKASRKSSAALQRRKREGQFSVRAFGESCYACPVSLRARFLLRRVRGRGRSVSSRLMFRRSRGSKRCGGGY